MEALLRAMPLLVALAILLSAVDTVRMANGQATFDRVDNKTDINTQWCADSPTLKMVPTDTAADYTTQDLSKTITNFTITVADVNENLFIRSVSKRVAVDGAELNNVVFHNLTQIYVGLKVGEGGLELFKAHTVTLKVAKTGFMCSELPSAASVQYTYKKTESLVDPEQQQATVAVAQTAGAVSGVASSSTLATQTARASMVLTLTECKFSHTTALDSSSSPTGYRFGHSEGGYYRGAIVGNMFIMLGLGVFQLLIGLVVGVAWKPFRTKGCPTSIVLGIERVHFPGLLIVPFATMLPGTSMAATALALHGGDKELDIVMSILTFCYLVGVLGFFAFRLTAGFGAKWIPDAMEYNKVMKVGQDLPVFHRTFHGSHRWSDGGKNFKNAYGPLFADYREKFGWFITIELLVTVAAGVLDGIRPSDGNCLGVGIGVLICNFLITVPAVFIRPCHTLYNTSHFILNTTLTFISSIFLVVSQVGGGNQTIALVTTWISTVTIYLAFVKAAGDALLGFQKVYWAAMDFRKKKKDTGKEMDTAEGAIVDKKNDDLKALAVEEKEPLVPKDPESSSAVPPKKESTPTGDGEQDFKGRNATFNRFNLDENDESLWDVRAEEKEDLSTDPFATVPAINPREAMERNLAPMGAAKYTSPAAAQKDLKNFTALSVDVPPPGFSFSGGTGAPGAPAATSAAPHTAVSVRPSNQQLLDEDPDADLL